MISAAAKHARPFAPAAAAGAAVAPLVARPAPVYQLGGRSMSTEPEAREAAEVMARYCRGDAAAFHRLYALLAAAHPRVPDRAARRQGRGRGRAAAHLPQGSRGALDVRARAPIRFRGSTRSRTAPAWTRFASASAAASGSARTASRRRAGRPHHGRRRRRRIPIPPTGPTRRPPPARSPRWRKLPDNQRQALILTKVHGRSIADAAMITGQHAGRDQAARASRLRDAAADARPQGGRMSRRARQRLRRSRARRGDRRRARRRRRRRPTCCAPSTG